MAVSCGLTMRQDWLRAGIAFKGSSFSAGEAQATLDTNLYGTANMCEAMKPLMREGARIVNVSSM